MSNKNLIYMVAVNHSSSVYTNSDYSEYAINSWKYWCEKNDVDFKFITEHDDRLGKPVWNKELVHKHAEEYDKIGVVDSDTMIKWDAPNIFDLYEDEFCGVNDNSSLRWIRDSVKVYSKFFPDLEIDYNTYINAGVVFFSKKHLDIFKQVLDFYLENREELDNWNKGGGKEQTIFNFHLVKNNVNLKLLNPEWNLISIHRKDMFSYNWQLNEDQTPFFIKYAYIWHFTGFPVEDRIKIMKKVWDTYRKNYE